jgi:hypothetical protein
VYRFLLVLLVGMAGSYSAMGIPTDTLVSASSLGERLAKGHFDLHARSYFMATSNQGGLADYATWAVGAGLGYVSPRFYGFQAGMSGFFTFRLMEQGLSDFDAATGAVNRYEILLYDMNDFENKVDLDRMEELFVNYRYKGLDLTYGRHKVNTPFLNEQDNRMRPNLVSGWTGAYRHHGWHAQGSWLSAVSPRGTVEWYSMAHSFGVYPFGRHVSGEPSQYKGNVRTRGLLVAGIKGKGLQAWHYYADRVFHLSYLRYERAGEGPHHWLAGVQGFYQTTAGHGGNANEQFTYRLPGEKTHGWGAKVGRAMGPHLLSLNYLRIGDTGRFLFPREWGREQFFASLSRERFEGTGDTDALALKYEYHPKGHVHGYLGAGLVQHPSVEDPRLNKYGVPSYYHFTGLIDFLPSGELEGLELKVQVVNKTAMQSAPVPDEYRINRVDMWNFSVIMDYRF